MSFRRILALLLCALLPAARASAASPVADAAEHRDWTGLAAALKAGVPANEPQADGMTALHWSVRHDHLEATKQLIAAGAKATAENHYGVTSLSLACENGSEPIVTALLAAGANANTTLRGGESVLMTAARTGKVGPVTALLAHGARIAAKDRKGQTALMWAAAEGNTEVVEVLIKAGADVHERLNSGFTPMLFAVREGRTSTVQSLLKTSVDVNEVPGEDTGKMHGVSALVLAIENGHFELARLLLNAGADANDQRSGFTPLHILTWVRKPNRGDSEDGQPPPIGSGNLTSLELVRELMKHGARVNERLAQYASSHGQNGIAGTTPLYLAAKTADLPLMKLLLELGANPLLPNHDNSTPLMAAAGLGCKAPTEEAGTEDECLEAVKLLLDHGADINTVDAKGETAMHGAAYKSLPKMVAFLAQKGVKIDVWNRKNKSGWTPLLIAEGYRPGNFKPSAETMEAIQRVMLAAGVTPPLPTPRSSDDTTGYRKKKAAKR